jgi:hypothetical protein
MELTEAQTQLIAKLHLRGTLLEQLVLRPGVLSDPQEYLASPSLMRLAMDVSRTLASDAWAPSGTDKP